MKVTDPHADPAKLRALADLLDDDYVNDFVMAVVSDARDAGPRLLNAHGDPADVDSGAVVEAVLAAAREAA